MDLKEGNYKDYTKYGFNVDNYADANKALCVIFVILIVIANVLLMIKYMTKGNVLFNPKSLTIISMAIGDVFLALFALTLKAEVFFKGFDSLSCGSLKSSWAYTNYLLNFVYGMGVVTLAAEIVYRRKTQGASKSKVYRLVSSLLFSSAPWVLGVVIILPLVLVNIDSVTCQSYQTKDQIKAQVMVSIMLPAIVAVLTCIVLKCQVPSKDLNAISTVLRRTLKFRTQNPAAQTSHKASSTNVNQDFQAAETSPPADDLKPRGIFAITRTGTETSAASQATQPTAPFQDMQPTAPTQALQPTAPTQNGHFPIHHYPQTQMDAHEPNFVLTDGQYAFHGQQPNENCSPPLAPPNTCYPVFVNPAFQPDNLDIKQPNTTFMVNAQIHDNSTHQRLQEGIDCQESQFHPTLHHPKGFNPLTHNPNIETFVPLSTSERTSEQYPFLNQHIQSSYNQDPAQQNGQQPPYFTSAQPNTQQPPYPMDLQRNSQQPPYPINLQPNTQQFSYPIVPQPNSQQPPHNTSAQPNTQQTPYPIIPQPNIQQPPYPIVPQLNTQQSPYPIVPQPNTQQPPYPIVPQPNTQQLLYPIVPQPNTQQPPYPIVPQPNIQQPPYPIVPQLNTQQSPYPIVPQPNTQQPPYPIVPQPNTQQLLYPILPQLNGQQAPYPINPQPNSQQPLYSLMQQPTSQQPPYPILTQADSQQLPYPVPAQPSSMHISNQSFVQPVGQPIINSLPANQSNQRHLLNPAIPVHDQDGLQVAPYPTNTVKDQDGLQVAHNPTRTVQGQDGIQVAPYPTNTVRNQNGRRAARIPNGKSIPRVQGKVRAIPSVQGKVRAIPSVQGKVRAIPSVQGKVRAVPSVQGKVRAIPSLHGEFRDKEKGHLLAVSIFFFLLVMPYAIFDISQPAMAVTSLVIVKEIVTWLMVGRSVVTPCIMHFYDGN